MITEMNHYFYKSVSNISFDFFLPTFFVTKPTIHFFFALQCRDCKTEFTWRGELFYWRFSYLEQTKHLALMSALQVATEANYTWVQIDSAFKQPVDYSGLFPIPGGQGSVSEADTDLCSLVLVPVGCDHHVHQCDS